MASKLIHKVIPVGFLQCNCSILADAEAREAIVVDPGDEADVILEILRHDDLKVRAIVSTHTHIDHVGGLAKLHRATGAPVLIHRDDLQLYSTVETQAQWIGVPTPEIAQIDEFLKEGDSLRWGGFAAHILHTPGHTQGSICLVVEPDAAPHTHESPPARGHAPAARRLLAGDTLFQGSIGRTDLPGGSFPQIIRSIHDKLLVLPDEMLVIPGHGDTTTIGDEREHNPFLR